jgi:hypothetical protein
VTRWERHDVPALATLIAVHDCLRSIATMASRSETAHIVEPRRRSRKGTYAYLLRSIRTLRFLLITRAGRLTCIGGRNILRLSQNPATEALYSRVEHALAD